MTYKELKKRCDRGEVVICDLECLYNPDYIPELQGIDSENPEQFINRYPELFDAYETQIDYDAGVCWIFKK